MQLVGPALILLLFGDYKFEKNTGPLFSLWALIIGRSVLSCFFLELFQGTVAKDGEIGLAAAWPGVGGK